MKNKRIQLKNHKFPEIQIFLVKMKHQIDKDVFQVSQNKKIKFLDKINH